jgi:DNA invertase Pin-like site-specific DNA recombinase
MDLYQIRNELHSGKSIYDLNLRVTYYARVSTDKDEQAHSLQNQIQYYTNFIKQNTKWAFVDGYIDEGLSGTSVNKRESFLKMISDAKLKKFDFIITKEISRFSRNTLDSIKYTQQLLSYGVGVLFQSDNINTLMPDAELRLTIMSSIAQDEVRKISERVKFGFKRAVENGIVLGNSKIWGYKKDNGKLVIVEEEAKIVRDIFYMYATQNMGIRAICSYLDEQGIVNTKGNSFSFSTIKGILTNPKYMGFYCGNKSHKFDYKLSDRKYMDQSEWVMYKDEEKVPPIVSEEIWEKANFILRARSAKQSAEDKSSYQNKYAYSGKVICMEHGVPYYRSMYRYESGNKEVWQCKRYVEKGREGCQLPTIYTTELDMLMKDAYNTLIMDRTSIINDLVKTYSSICSESKIREDIAKIKVEIDSIMKMKDKLLYLSIEGRISDDEFEIRNNQFNDDIEKLRIRHENLLCQEQKNKNITVTVENLRKIIAKELDFEGGFDNGIIDSFLDRIEVYKSEDKKQVNLKVYFKLFGEGIDYSINRSRNNTSVCSTQYI